MTDIIANILLREIGSTPKVQPVTPSTGLGAMTSRKGITAPQEEQQADPTQNIQRPIIDIYRKIVQQEIGDGSGLTGDKIPYDPLVDTPETLAARGYNPDEVLRNSVFSSTISGTKGRTPKDKILTDIEDLIQSYEDKRLAKKRFVSKERATASSSILDVLEAELRRGMTSKQTDTQPTVSADSSRDRFELQGEMRDLPVLDDEDAPEVDTRSNEMLEKPVEQPVGIMARPDPQFNPIDKAIEEKTSNFYLKIGENAESDHGSTPVATNDASEKNKPLAQRSKDIGFGHKIKSSEEASGEIHGVKFKNEDNTYIPLTEEQKVFILNKDMEVQLDLARRTGWDTKLKKLGISWDDLDYKYQNALTSLAYNAKNAGRKWTAVLKAAKDKDPISFAKEMRRKDNKKYTSGMDNRVAKELYYAGIISSLDEVSSVLPLANATVAGLPQSSDSA